LCGIPADERALDVDHIIPRKAGGADSPENFQALCWLCNTNKGAGDDADFRNPGTLYGQKQNGCVFCEIAWADGGRSLVIFDRQTIQDPDALFLFSTDTGDKKRVSDWHARLPKTYPMG